MGVMFNYYKSVYHPIPTLFVDQGTPWQFSKQISKLYFQLIFQIYYFLVQTKGERRFLEGVRRGTTLQNYPQEYLVDIRDEKVSPFVKFEIKPPCFIFF